MGMRRIIMDGINFGQISGAELEAIKYAKDELCKELETITGDEVIGTITRFNVGGITESTERHNVPCTQAPYVPEPRGSYG